MNLSDKTRRYLVVGGTGMLFPFCRSVAPENLIVAARFVSNEDNLSLLSDAVKKVSLDYEKTSSRRQFLQYLSQLEGLRYCVLWVHSQAHDFSCQVIEILATFDKPVKVIHIFGSKNDEQTLVAYADKYQVDFTLVKLGQVQTETGWRWLTHNEISAKVTATLK